MSSTASTQPEPLEIRIQSLEAGYEFLLAFAAQGREEDTGAGQTARSTLFDMSEAIDWLVNHWQSESNPFARIVREDARKVHAALTLILGLPRINSELIDNLNASIHLRALLTDLFILSESEKMTTRNGPRREHGS